MKSQDMEKKLIEWAKKEAVEKTAINAERAYKCTPNEVKLRLTHVMLGMSKSSNPVEATIADFALNGLTLMNVKSIDERDKAEAEKAKAELDGKAPETERMFDVLDEDLKVHNRVPLSKRDAVSLALSLPGNVSVIEHVQPTPVVSGVDPAKGKGKTVFQIDDETVKVFDSEEEMIDYLKKQLGL